MVRRVSYLREAPKVSDDQTDLQLDQCSDRQTGRHGSASERKAGIMAATKEYEVIQLSAPSETETSIDTAGHWTTCLNQYAVQGWRVIAALPWTDEPFVILERDCDPNG